MDTVLKSLDSILENMEFLSKLYDVIRVVDPVKKEIIKYYNPNSLPVNHHCYSSWNIGKICESCSSVRAYLTNQTVTKIEYDLKNLYIVTSLPIQFKEGKFIIELLKDISDSGIVKDFDTQDAESITNLINELNSAIVTDELTKLYNRRFVNERLPADMAISILRAHSTSLVICDIDSFKLINDSYGHLAGDYVLQEFSSCLKKHTKNETDWVARYGGDEFLICLNNTDSITAVKIIERIRVEIENMPLEYEENSFRITSSFGIYTTLSHNLSMNDLIEMADKNLYEAKKAGRNKIVCS